MGTSPFPEDKKLKCENVSTLDILVLLDRAHIESFVFFKDLVVPVHYNFTKLPCKC